MKEMNVCVYNVTLVVILQSTNTKKAVGGDRDLALELKGWQLKKSFGTTVVDQANSTEVDKVNIYIFFAIIPEQS